MTAWSSVRAAGNSVRRSRDAVIEQRPSRDCGIDAGSHRGEESHLRQRYTNAIRTALHPARQQTHRTCDDRSNGCPVPERVTTLLDAADRVAIEDPVLVVDQ